MSTTTRRDRLVRPDGTGPREGKRAIGRRTTTTTFARASVVDSRAVEMEMGGRGTTSGDGGGGFSSKIMGLKVGERRAREGGGRGRDFFCRARDKA